VKICGRNYFRADEIDAWIEAQTARRCDDDANNDNDGRRGAWVLPRCAHTHSRATAL
jgi:hypothetical protein